MKSTMTYSELIPCFRNKGSLEKIWLPIPVVYNFSCQLSLFFRSMLIEYPSVLSWFCFKQPISLILQAKLPWPSPFVFTALVVCILRLGCCLKPYQRLRLYNGAPFRRLYDTLGIRRTSSRLKPPASLRGYVFSIKLCLMVVRAFLSFYSRLNYPDYFFMLHYRINSVCVPFK